MSSNLSRTTAVLAVGTRFQDNKLLARFSDDSRVVEGVSQMDDNGGDDTNTGCCNDNKVLRMNIKNISLITRYANI